MRIHLASVIALALAVPTFAGEPQKPAREVVVWGASIGADTKGQDAVKNEFERRHPDIKVKLLTMGAGKMDPQKLMTSIVGNVAPDVVLQDRFSLSDWASKNAFRPLDDLIAADAGKDPLCPKPSQYYPVTWNEACFGGKVFGIPTGADDRILYINRTLFNKDADLLRAAGCDPDRAPRTWREVLRYSRALTKWNSDGTLKQAGFMPNYGNSWLYFFSFQTNASFMSPDGRKCTLDTDRAEQALRFMIAGYDLLLKETKLEDAYEYIDKGTGPLAHIGGKNGYEIAKSFESGFLSKENDAFLIGKVGMVINGNWMLADPYARYGPSLNFETYPVPVPDDRYNKTGDFVNEKDTFITWVGGFAMSIPRGARHVDAAWEYIKFASSSEGRMVEATAQAAWEKHRGRPFIPSLSASVEANEAIFKKFKPASPRFAAALRMHIDAMDGARIRPATFAGQVLWNEHVRAMESAMYHKATPKDTLLSSQAIVQRDLDAYFDREKYSIIDLNVPLKIGIVIVVLALIACWVLFQRLPLGRLGKGEAKWAYLFISPWLIGFLLLTLGPMLASLFFSFTQYDVLNEARWVGLNNYAVMFTSDRERVMKALGNAIYLAAIGVPLGLGTGLAIALLLNTASRGIRFYRTLFYMPAIVPTITSAVLWGWVLTPDPNKGLINAYWSKTITPWLGVAPPPWLQSADWSKNSLILMGVWGAGSGMLLWLAGLKGVAPSLYEASSLDGATSKQQFWKITFPQLSPIIFFNTVMGFIGAMQEFDRAYVMKPSSDGPIGPDDSLLTPVYLLFQNGFAYFKMGYASSIAWLIFGIILLLTYLQWWLAPKWVHYETNK